MGLCNSTFSDILSVMTGKHATNFHGTCGNGGTTEKLRKLFSLLCTKLLENMFYAQKCLVFARVNGIGLNRGCHELGLL